MPKVSVIVPVYRVEAYLLECLQSISNQTYRDFELILVDDGSPDSCGAMCDAYAAQHTNTRVLHTDNAGLSEARNRGVRVAVGEYVVFVDSDDYVSPDYVEYLVYLADKYGSEVSCAERLSFWDGEPLPEWHREEQEWMMPAGQALSAICYNKMPICAWGKLYKRHLLETFPYPAGQLYEDTATTYKIVGAAGAMAYGNRPVYYWRQRKGSITHAVITERHLYGVVAAKEQIDYMRQYYPEALPAANARCAMKILDLSYRLIMGKMDADLFQRLRRELKPILPALLKDKKAGISLKIRSVALSMGYLPYLLLSKLYRAAKGTSL